MKIIPFYLFVVFLSFISSASANPNIFSNFIGELHSAYDSILQKLEPPPDFDFWKTAQGLGDSAVEYADRKLKEEMKLYSVAAETIEEVMKGVKDLISSAEGLRIDAMVNDFNITAFTEDLTAEIEIVFAELMLEFEEPPPENQTERYQMREAAVIKALDKIEDALVKVYRGWDISESEAREQFSHVKPRIKHLVLVIGNLADNHPLITEIVLVSAVALIVVPIAEGLILRPLLSVFGFTPLGPAKGTPAAWAQGYFFGAAVSRGTWFAALQAAAMK